MLRCVRKRLRITKRSFSTNVFSSVSDEINTENAQKIWQDAVTANAPEAMSHRASLFRAIEKERPLWALTILERLPTNLRTIDDFRFALNILLHNELLEEARNMLLSVARRHPIYWESLMYELAESEPIHWILPLFCESLVAQGMTYTLSHPGPPSDKILQVIVKRVLASGQESDILTQILDSMVSTVLSSRLATAILRSCYILHMNPEHTGILSWKLQKHIATSEDLKYSLLGLLRIGEPLRALQLYDTKKQSVNTTASGLDEVVLAAAASASQWDRLESMFNEMAAVPGKYKTVLSVLSALGGTHALEEIWHQLVEVDKIKPTYGICHAIMFSMRQLGETARVQHYFYELVKYLPPLRSSFRLLLGAYRDASDIRSALELMSEMSGTHQLPLTAAEFSILLSLCAKLRDFQSSSTVWTWAHTVLHDVDIPLKNSYLKCLVETNHQEEALKFWTEEFDSARQGIDTLTIMLGLAARKGNAELFKAIVDIAEQQGVKKDAAWFVEIMRFYARVGDYPNAWRQFSEMKKLHIQPHGDHYSLVGTLQKKYHLADDSAKTYENARKNNALSFGFMGQQLRLFAGNSEEDVRRIGERVALDLLKGGGNDTSSDVLARSKVPVSTVKATIRTALRPGGDPRIARKILDRLHENPSFTQPWMVWGQELIYYSRLNNWRSFDRAWNKFFEVVRRNATVLQDDKSYKLPPRYRLVFEQQVTARIRQLAAEKKCDSLLNLQNELNAIGIKFTRRNWNLWVCALVEAGEIIEAFRIVKREGTFGRSRSGDSKPVGVRPMTRAVLIKNWLSLVQLVSPKLPYPQAAEVAVQSFGYPARYVRQRYENPKKVETSNN